MIKAEQVPDAVIDAAVAMRDRGGSMSDIIRTAINAWPGMGPIRADQPIGDWCDKLPAIILPLPQEGE